VYLNRLANSCKNARALAGTEQVRQLVPAHTNDNTTRAADTDEKARPHSNGAASTSGVPRDSSGTSVSQHLQQVFAELEQHMERALGDPGQLQAVLGKLNGMVAAPVTAAMLKDEGWGHKLKALSKCSHKDVSVAAKNVITAWKQRICKELQ
jgi:hypothetical protein